MTRIQDALRTALAQSPKVKSVERKARGGRGVPRVPGSVVKPGEVKPRGGREAAR